MKNLGELLKEYKGNFPVKLNYSALKDNCWFSVFDFNDRYAIGFHRDEEPDYFLLSSEGWSLYQEPKKTRKEKRYAWLVGFHDMRLSPRFTYAETHALSAEFSVVERAPWLDGEVLIEE